MVAGQATISLSACFSQAVVNCAGAAAGSVKSHLEPGWGSARQCNESRGTKGSCMSGSDYDENDNMRVKGVL